MGTVKLNDLKKTGKELNELLFNPGEEQIDIKGKEDVLAAQIIEAAEEVEEDEFEDLSETAQQVITTLRENTEEAQPKKGGKPAPAAEKDEDEEDEEDKPNEKPVVKKGGKPETKKAPAPVVKDEEPEGNLTLEEMVEETDDLDELKDLCKSDDAFKPLRQGLGIQKDAKKLKAKMLEILHNAQEVPQATSKAEKKAPSAPTKKETKPVAKKAEKKAFSRVDAVCVALKEAPESFQAWLERADEIMVENGGKPNEDESKSQAIKIIQVSKHFDFGVNVPEFVK